jgi:hypothetical protein
VNAVRELAWFALGASVPIVSLWYVAVRFATRAFARVGNNCECGREATVLDVRFQSSSSGRPTKARLRVYCVACAQYYRSILPPIPRWVRQDGERVA